ncbi:kinase-like protein [Lactarius pseudohatsudake]|nr:kinase-like protein [Lactarius pseudohatsudake]
MDFTRINGVYRLQRKIGSGSFGEVFFARDVLLLQDVVIKLEPLKARQHFLEHEYHVYQKLSGGIGIPHVRWFGTEGGFDAMALDLLGQSLEDLFVSRHFKFTVHTVLLLADQLVCRLKYIHSRNFIHRDLKPSNIVIGLGTQANIVYLIDFGLSKEYRDPYTNKHIPPNTNLGLTGTATFASINSHLGLELGRRDDMESLAYILIYFLRGHLPWQGLPHGSQDIVECKQRTTPHDLCDGLPVEFCTFLEYCRSLSFEKKPDYGYISDLFDGLSLREGFQHDSAFDWDGTNNEQPHNSPAKGTVRGRHGQPPRRREGLRSQTRQRSGITST